MPTLRLVTAEDTATPAAPAAGAAVTDDQPRVSLRLLMAASGRCSCDACLLAYRAGDRTAGIVSVRSAAPALRLAR